MRLAARGWLVAGCVVMMSGAALGAGLSTALRNFYAEYEVVLECQKQAQLTAADAELAKAAIAKIETHYVKRDASIDKARLLKQAAADKDEGFKIVTRSAKSDLRPYCRMSLKELLAKAEEIDPSGSVQ
jgi:predicted secreted protein